MAKPNHRMNFVAALVVVLIAFPIVKQSEGLRTAAYLDPVGIPTICFGETLNVRMGQKKTTKECEEMLMRRLSWFLDEMRSCTKPALPAETEAAFLSFAYNLGTGVYCENIARKRLNQGKYTEACNALLLYTKAGNPRRTLPGLVTRRKEEHALCMEGLRKGRLL